VTADFKLLDCLADGFVCVDAAWRVTYSNPALTQKLGLAADSVTGRDLFDAIFSLRGSPAEPELRAAMAQSAPRRCSAPLTWAARSFELRASPLPEGGLALQFVDVSHRTEHDQGVSEDLMRLAHDLRNPLAPLRTSLEILNRPTIPEASKERARGIMARQLTQMVGLIDKLQVISREVVAYGDTPRRRMEPHQPNEEVPAPAPTGPDVCADGDRGARVLVADDNALVQQSVVALLRAEGYEVRTVSDGVEAIAVAQEWKPRYVLLDLHMPRVGGIEAAKRLREAHPAGEMVLLMMSGVALDDSWRSHAGQAGFDACIDKTADPAEWLSTMRRAGAAASPGGGATSGAPNASTTP